MLAQPTLPSITITPAEVLSSPLVVQTKDERHRHRRFFIGPLPEKVVSNTEKHVKAASKRQGLLRTDPSPAEGLSQIIKDNAFAFFIRQGGKEEDWGEDAEQGVREEMMRMFRESEWGAIWGKKLGGGKKEKEDKRWVGGSFEVGEFLGVNILEEERAGSLSSRQSKGTVRSPVSSSPSTPPGAFPTSTSAGQTFITAPSEPVPRSSIDGDISNGYSAHAVSAGSSSTIGLLSQSSPDSAITPNSAPTEVIRRQMFTNICSPGANSEGDVTNKKGKQKLVHYAVETRTSEGAVSLGPVSPTEVLQRTGSDMGVTCAGAAAEASQNGSTLQEVVMRDRMLVRVSYTISESINSFDEQQNRTTSHLQYEDWAEFMVVWRGQIIELYEDYSLPGKELVTGHKHLAFIVPLYSSQTRLSLYSFVDLTFCLTCPPAEVGSTNSKSRAMFHKAKEGTNIFVFKVKSRSRALCWTWKIWRQLGGQLPPFIEIRSAALDTRVKVDLPENPITSSDYSMFTRDNIIALCIKVLSKMRDWKYIMEKQMQEGKTLELAWRWGTYLDWVWLENDEGRGEGSGWNVLCGLALKHAGKPCHLEIRMGDHFPTTLHLSSGEQLREPPAIEGYLDQIKPNTQMKQAVYLVTHDGNIFSLSPSHAHPPSPPGVHQGGGGEASGATDRISMREEEVRRGAKQVMAANGVSDLRSLAAVRRAFQIVPQHSHEPPSGQGKKDVEDDEWAMTWAMQPEIEGDPEHLMGGNNDDEGGDEEMVKAVDKAQLRVRRSFELLLTSGHVIRFEAYSQRVALEWVSRLRELITYWKYRHRIDAREEMDLAEVGSRRPRLTPHMHVCMYDHDMPPEAPADPDTNLPALGRLYNWCVLEGCRSIVKGGKVFTRRGLRGQYKLVQLLLVAGHLVQYRVTPKSALHHRRKRSINLLDAYVCSGYFAALALPRDQYTPDASTAPRRYQDGLEADDPEEDMLFVLLYRPTAGAAEGAKRSTHIDVPALSAKRKMVVFRTRSKLERDAWCWALSCEIEKLIKKNAVREELLRETGNLTKP